MRSQHLVIVSQKSPSKKKYCRIFLISFFSFEGNFSKNKKKILFESRFAFSSFSFPNSTQYTCRRLNSFCLCVYNFVLYCVLDATTKQDIHKGSINVCTEITEHRHWHDREMSIVWHRKNF